MPDFSSNLLILEVDRPIVSVWWLEYYQLAPHSWLVKCTVVGKYPSLICVKRYCFVLPRRENHVEVEWLVKDGKLMVVPTWLFKVEEV